ERLGDLLRRQPQRARAVLIDLQSNGLLLLVPVELHVARARVGTHGGAHFIGYGAHAVAVRPVTRNCTGNPTGGPKFNRSMRRRASGITFWATSPSSRALSRSRASAPLVIITMSAKLSFGNTGFRARKNRGEPAPI